MAAAHASSTQHQPNVVQAVVAEVTRWVRSTAPAMARVLQVAWLMSAMNTLASLRSVEPIALMMVIVPMDTGAT